METQQTLKSKKILRKKYGSGEINLPNFRLYYKATVIMTVWYWHQKRKYKPMEQVRKPRDKHMQLIFGKGGKNIPWGIKNLFNKWCWEHWTATCERVTLGYFQRPYTKINSKRNKDLYVTTQSYKTFRGKNKQTTL